MEASSSQIDISLFIPRNKTRKEPLLQNWQHCLHVLCLRFWRSFYINIWT